MLKTHFDVYQLTIMGKSILIFLFDLMMNSKRIEAI